MMPTVGIPCPHCRKRTEVPYIMIGAPQYCPSCGREVVFEMPVGATYPDTGDQITYRDFEQLLTYPAYGPAVHELLADWFNFRVRAREGTLVVLTPSGDTVNLVRLHRRIQEDPVQRLELYRTAMSLWR